MVSVSRKRSLIIDTSNSQQSSTRPFRQNSTAAPFSLPVSLWCAGGMSITNIHASTVKNIDVDRDSQKDPNRYCPEYVNELYLYFNDQEQKLSPDNTYMNQHPLLHANHRNALVDTMVRSVSLEI